VRRILIPITAVIVIVLALGVLLGGVTSSTAMTVNGQTISTSTIDSQLAAINASPGYTCYLKIANIIRTQSVAAAKVTPVGATSANYSSEWVASWLNQQVTNTLTAQAAVKLGLPQPSAAALATAKEDLLSAMDDDLSQATGTTYDCKQTAAQIFAGLPTSFVSDLVGAHAMAEAFLVKQGGMPIDESSVADYYNAHTSSFDTICVSVIETTDSSVYPEVTAGLAAGTSFADLAKQYSGASNAASGGSLGCFTPSSTSYSSLTSLVGSLAAGETSGLETVGSTDAIFHIDKRTATPFSEVADVVRRTILANDASKATAAANALVRSSTVSVNPRYGTWTKSKAAVGVAIPVSPPLSSLLNAAAIQPGATGT